MFSLHHALLLIPPIGLDDLLDSPVLVGQVSQELLKVLALFRVILLDELVPKAEEQLNIIIYHGHQLGLEELVKLFHTLIELTSLKALVWDHEHIEHHGDFNHYLHRLLVLLLLFEVDDHLCLFVDDGAKTSKRVAHADDRLASLVRSRDVIYHLI